MRWGEPTRLPPVRRGRGLAAAGLLAVGLVAAYAILAALSLTSVAPSVLQQVPTTLQGIVHPGSVSAAETKAEDVLKPTAAPSFSELVPPTFIGRSSLSQTQTFGVANTALLPVNLSVTVIGAPGVTAAFPNSRTAKR